MRAFVRYRAILKENEDILLKIRVLDDKLNKAFKYLLDKIDALHQKKLDESRKRIGFKSNN